MNVGTCLVKYAPGAILLAACGLAGCAPVGGALTQVFPPRRGDPEPEPVLFAEIAHLPYPRVEWQHRLDVARIERITEGEEHLYVESDDRRLFAIQKKDGYVAWIYATARREPFRFPPVEVPEIARRRAELERELDEINRQIEEESDRTRLDYDRLAQLRSRRREIAGRIEAEQQGDFVYLITTTHLIAVDRRSGREMWRTRLEFGPSAAPAATRTTVYVPSGDWSRVYAIDVQSEGFRRGFLRLHLGGPERAITASPVLWGDLVIAVSHDGALYGFDRASGQVVWTHSTPAPLSVTPAVFRTGGAVAASWLIFPGTDGAIYAFDLAARRLVWRYATDGVCRRTPQSDGELVYVHVEGDGLLALELEAGSFGGRLRWRFPGGERYLGPTARGVLLEGPGRMLTEVARDDGRILGQFFKGHLEMFLPSRDGRRMYAATPGGRIYALDRVDSGLPPDSVRSWQ
jgi:outer membrane protein assembly factor BamB